MAWLSKAEERFQREPPLAHTAKRVGVMSQTRKGIGKARCLEFVEQSVCFSELQVVRSFCSSCFRPKKARLRRRFDLTWSVWMVALHSAFMCQAVHARELLVISPLTQFQCKHGLATSVTMCRLCAFFGECCEVMEGYGWLRRKIVLGVGCLIRFWRRAGSNMYGGIWARQRDSAQGCWELLKIVAWILSLAFFSTFS